MAHFDRTHRTNLSEALRGNKNGCMPWGITHMTVADPILPYVIQLKKLYLTNKTQIKTYWQETIDQGEVPDLSELFEVELKINGQTYGRTYVSDGDEISEEGKGQRAEGRGST